MDKSTGCDAQTVDPKNDENMKIVSLKSAPSDLSALFRELAEKADDGRLTSAVIAYVSDDCYEFAYGASLSQCVVLSSLLNQNSVDRMRR